MGTIPFPGIMTVGLFPWGQLWSAQYHNECEACKWYQTTDRLVLKIEPSMEGGDPVGSYRVYLYVNEVKDSLFKPLVPNGQTALYASVWLYEPQASVTNVVAYA